LIPYVELHAASAFSFLQGASLPEELVSRAAELGYPALAVLDADGVYGVPRFHKAAKAAGLRAIVGAELTMTADSGQEAGGSVVGERWRLPVLVETREGYRNLCRLITRMKLRASKGEGALTLEELDGETAGLVGLAGQPVLDTHRHGVGGLLDRLVGVFGRRHVYVELQRHMLRGEVSANATLTALAEAFRVPVVATGGVRFARPADRPLFDVLTCVRHRTTLDAAGRRLARNAEAYLKPPEAMAQLFADRPDALNSAQALAERLEYTMDDLDYRFPLYPVPHGETAASFLCHVVEAGARDRYRPYHDKARHQIARELALIEKLELAGYFLIVWDIVNYCRQQNILVQGRGSAANSAVCYSLGITAVDPIAMDLLFERFLSEERGEWPDIDLDLPSGDRRERVIQYVYRKYGRLGAAMTANVITYRDRSAAREVGKVLSLDPAEIDRLASLVPHIECASSGKTLERQLREAGVPRDLPRLRNFAALWMAIQDLPRHLGQHSGGMVVCQDSLDSVVPLEPAAMPGRVVVQWDKDDCADMGIVKVDLLGLGMMAVLQDAVTLVNTTGERGHDAGAVARLDLAHLPSDDPAVYELLQRADTIGIFQVESRAQMATLPRLKPTCFYDLVVEVALIRPGPIVGQMVHPYLNRRAGREPVRFLHPSLEPILARTLGVPLFQEQLLRMAMAVAGFTGGQAEELRRAMGFKRSEQRMRVIATQLREGMTRQGITGETADRIVLAIGSFALYGFPESHAASFALLTYASAYLKVHYPAAFYTALLNNQPMGFYRPATLVKDAQRRGVRFEPVDVQQSSWPCRVEADGAIRLGLMYVSGLRKEAGQVMAAFDQTGMLAPPVLCAKCDSDDESMIEALRSTPTTRTYFCNTCAHEWTIALRQAGRFRSIEDLTRRAGLRRDEVMALADIGALNAFTGERRSALWQAARVTKIATELFDDGGRDRLGGPEVEESPLRKMTPAERLRVDYGGTGLTLGPHPMALHRADLAMRGVLRAVDLGRTRDGRRVRVAGMVITRQRPGTAKGFVFLTLEDETGVVDVIIRPALFDRQHEIIVKQSFLVVDGVLQNQEGVQSVRAEQLRGLEGAASFEAHDFY
jgi:error-prone DNA polymerase